MQRERRHDPYPWTWEPAGLVGLLVMLGLTLGLQLGRSLANLIAGVGWTWPGPASPDHPTLGPGVRSPVAGAFWRSLPGVLSGNAGAGLTEPVPHGLAGPGLVWASVAVTELTILAALVVLGVQAYLRWGPGRLRGMATRSEAEQILGVTRIRKVAGIVRPDLYGKYPAHFAGVAPAAASRRGPDPVWTPIYQAQTQQMWEPTNLERDLRLRPRTLLPHRRGGRKDR